MTLTDRPSPAGKRVSLFVTCMVDMLYPGTGMSVVDILAHLGIAVEFPPDQTCCGQPAYNGGYRREARQVAVGFLNAFRDAEVIVAPSGSCVAMVRHEYPRLFAGEPALLAEAERLAGITWEFTEFIVHGLGITDLRGRLPAPQTIAFHDACHGLRLLGLKQAARTLVENLENATVVEWDDSETCCGFGGLFSVQMPEISAAMAERKAKAIEGTSADIVVTSETGCWMQLHGILSRRGSTCRAVHLAELLAGTVENG